MTLENPPARPPYAEIRAAERVKIDAFVIAGGEYVFRTRDVSTSGMFLYTRVAHMYPFKVGSSMNLELWDYDRCLECKVVVARVVEPGSAESDVYPMGFGVRIVEISQDAQGHLVDLIGRASQGDGPY